MTDTEKVANDNGDDTNGIVYRLNIGTKKNPNYYSNEIPVTKAGATIRIHPPSYGILVTLEEPPRPLSEEEKTKAITAMICAVQARGYDGKGMYSALDALLERYQITPRKA